MASYDRGILIPYLQDICAAEMLCRKLEQEIQLSTEEANKYTSWANGRYDNPKAPNPENYATDNNELTGGIVSLIIFGGPGLLLLPGLPFLGIVGIAMGVFMLVSSISEQREKDARAEQAYSEAMEKHRKQVAIQKSYRESIPWWREEAKKWEEKGTYLKEKLEEAKKLRNDAYSVNIIPSRYRSVHAAYYLYDYFNTCRENDLDKVIQTMLLDEIIQRMDKLIIQNQEIILNQRMQLAMLESQNQMLAENHREEMKQLARMETNQERQLDYLHMIEANQEVTNFFLAVDYIETHR